MLEQYGLKALIVVLGLWALAAGVAFVFVIPIWALVWPGDVARGR